MSNGEIPWRSDGVRIVRAADLDANTPQTPGMQRRAASPRRVPERSSFGRHGHHRRKTQKPAPTIMVGSRASSMWSRRSRASVGRPARVCAESAGRRFIYVPPYVPHQEINASEDLPVALRACASGQQGLVVNLDIIPVEIPELVRWIDDLHKEGSLAAMRGSRAGTLLGNRLLPAWCESSPAADISIRHADRMGESSGMECLLAGELSHHAGEGDCRGAYRRVTAHRRQPTSFV